MRHIHPGAAALAAALLASCAPRPAPPAPPPPPPAAPAQPEPPPPPADWRDAPLSGGDWSYREEQGRPLAWFGAVFVLRCESGRRVTLSRVGAAGDALTVRTTDGQRTLAAAARPDGLAASLAADDPLLDAIAFSRGRIAVEAAGAPPLILPAWPEPARVIEDCRE